MITKDILNQLLNGAEEHQGYCEKETPIGNIQLEVQMTPAGEKRMFRLDGKPIGKKKLIEMLTEIDLQ